MSSGARAGGAAGVPALRQKTAFWLPLVCRQGRPTALEHMSPRSLVKFVTFLLHHARVTDQRTAAAVRRLALTWPEALNGTNGTNGDALSKCPSGWLRRLVRCWYRMFGCELLLSLSAELEWESNRGRLRLQRNGDGTSSLWERSSDRLVVTYRDDSLYDGGPAAESPRSTPPGWTEPAASAQSPPPECPHCGAHFVTLAAAMAHERLCDGMGADVSDTESVTSEPTSQTVTQPQFLSYLGMVPAAGSREQRYQSPSSERRRRPRQRGLPPGELLLRLSRTDLSSPLGRRLLGRALRQPGEAGGRADRHCASRDTSAPPADFPVTWSAPGPPRRVPPRLYCFTARQRAERAAAFRRLRPARLGLSARSRALYSRVRPCRVVLRRLKRAGVSVSASRHPPAAARVLLPRLTQTEIAAWLTGSGLTPPVTPSDRTAAAAHQTPPPAWLRVPRHQHRPERQKLLRDECKTIRDAQFFRLLSRDGRVTRGDQKAPRLPLVATDTRRPRSKSEGDALGGGSSGISRLEIATPYRRRRMSLLGSMQDKLHHIGTKTAASHITQPLRESHITNIPNGAHLAPSTTRPISPCIKPASPVPPQTPNRDSPTAKARKLPLAVGHLMLDECKTLRDREFVQLLNQPCRTTRSAASERRTPEKRRRQVNVWLHWPGFAREPDHQTPVKHARAAEQPRVCRVPVVRLERLFERLEPAATGGGSSSSGGGERPGSCRRRLALDATDEELRARFIAGYKRRLLPGPLRGEEERTDASSPREAVPLPPPPPPQPPPAQSISSCSVLLVRTACLADTNCAKQTADCYCQGLLKRPRTPHSKTFSESQSRLSSRGEPLDFPVDTLDNNNIASDLEPDLPEKRPRGPTEDGDRATPSPAVARPSSSHGRRLPEPRSMRESVRLKLRRRRSRRCSLRVCSCPGCQAT